MSAELPPPHPALAGGGVAVVTGAAGGIGLSAARQLAALGLDVVLADLPGKALDAAAASIGGRATAIGCDVADWASVQALADAAFARGDVVMLMNNAGIGANPGKPWEGVDGWRHLIDVNLWGAVYGVQAFAPRMIASGRPALIVNTGSKQGITTPPGNLAYNVSKAALKVFTEGLAHALRNEPGAAVSAHLLIPGFTFTPMTRGDRVEKPAGAWTPDEVVDFMVDALARGDFYILCPDNETDRATDERRMAWAIGDVIENRPALSRWHPDHKVDFEAFMKR